MSMEISLTAWKRKMRTASFRGVGFGVLSASDTVGRATVTHIFPHAGNPYSEDMGRAPRRVLVQGFLIGADYMERRDRLMAALEKSGGGELVHPWFGTMYVAQEEPAKVMHSAEDGGVCMVEMRFVRIERGLSLTAEPSLADVVAERAEACLALAEKALNAITLAKSVQWTVLQLVGDVNSVLNTLSRALSVDLGGFLSWRAPSGSISSGVRGETVAYVDEESLSALTEKKSLGSALRAVMDGAASAAPSGTYGGLFLTQGEEEENPSPMAMAGFAGSMAPSAAPSGLMGASRTEAYANHAALRTAVREMAAAHACVLAAEYAPASSREAEKVREKMLTVLDGVLLSAGDESYNAFRSLRSATVKAMAQKAGTAPDVFEVQQEATLPSLVIAWEHTGSIDAESSLVERNGVSHPGFVPGGQKLEVTCG